MCLRAGSSELLKTQLNISKFDIPNHTRSDKDTEIKSGISDRLNKSQNEASKIPLSLEWMAIITVIINIKIFFLYEAYKAREINSISSTEYEISLSWNWKIYNIPHRKTRYWGNFSGTIRPIITNDKRSNIE